MKKFNIFLFSSLFFIAAGCGSPENASLGNLSSDIKVCPKCHMELHKSKIFSATLNTNGTMNYFDDIGCMILWAHQNSINLAEVEVKVFTNDSKRYINALDAHYKLNEKTPMSYGFSADENRVENTIDFKEVAIKMLRGEHMANPKIRKQILGL
ncbi:MAG: hypothetical protein WC667_02955 [Sulfurimonas sp.]|jgi:hypothetical protein